MADESTSVINAILATYDSLSDSERRVADFILRERGAVSSLTAGEIARRSQTSNTTVSRFVRSLGFGSFSQLRLALAREEVAKTQAFDSSTSISFDDVAGTLAYVRSVKDQELADTVAMLDPAQLTEVARLMQRARSVLFVGVGTSLSFAQMAAVKFAQVGVHAIAPSTTDMAAVLSQQLGPDDCIVFFSNSGRSRRLQIIMDNAIDASTPTVLVTTDGTTALARHATHTVVVALHDQLLANDFSVSHNSLNFVVECLVLLLFHDNPDAQEHLRMFQVAFASEKQLS